MSPASEWVPVNARPVMVTQQTLRNLALGDKFLLRVAAVSSAGAGPAVVLDQPVHIQKIVGKGPPLCLLFPSPSQAPLLMDGGTKAKGQREQGICFLRPTLTHTSHMLLPSCLKKVPGSSAARDRFRVQRPLP